MNQESNITSLGDKGCQSFLRQDNKNCKINIIDFCFEKCFEYPLECFCM